MKTSAIILRRQLELALSEVTAAETALAEALRALERGVRAEKVTVSAVVERAFARVRTARAELAKLHEQAVAGLDDRDP